MLLSSKIKKAVREHVLISTALKDKNNWDHFTRTQFNIAARVINRQVTREVLANPELLELNLVMGKQNLEKFFIQFRCENVYEFLKYLANISEYRVFNWISGKTLQSYWNAGEAKYIKINALLVFLQVPFAEWDEWQKPSGASYNTYTEALPRIPFSGSGFSKSFQAVIKSYYLGNYFLYYQKTDGSPVVIKTPFILKEQENGSVIVKSVSEGHRYLGKVTGIRDGCLYINCQNLDFEEMEQYVFNIGLETKPQVLFGVSTTVSVKNRQAVALKNVLVKQSLTDPSFDHIQETEIPFSRKYSTHTEESIIMQYLRQATDNIIVSPSCCSLDSLRKTKGLRSPL